MLRNRNLKLDPGPQVDLTRIDIEAYLVRGRLERARAIRRALRRLAGRRPADSH